MTKPWNEYRDIIVGLYKHQNKPLHEVQQIMEEQYKFKASTRAYRSRFDRWKVHKYSCRRRRDSIANSVTSNFEEATATSPEDDSPGGSNSPPTLPAALPGGILPSADYVDDETSPVTLPKFEPPSSHYDDGADAPIHSLTVTPAAGAFTRDHQFRFSQFEHPQYLNLHMGNETAPGHECYQSDQGHTFRHQDQEGPTAALVGSPPGGQNGFSQMNNQTPMGYSYSLMEVLKGHRN